MICRNSQFAIWLLSGLSRPRVVYSVSWPIYQSCFK